jgi:MFS family permease
MAVAMTSGVMWFPLALPRTFGIDPATVGVGLGTAITVATLVGVLLAPALLRLRRGDAELDPLRVAAIFVALTPLPAVLLPFTASAFQAYFVAGVQGALGIAASSLMPGVLQNLAPPPLRSRVLALLGIVNALALAASPLAIGALSGLIDGPRGMLQAIAVVSLPSLIISAVLMMLAPRPYAATLRAIRPRPSQETM